MDADDRAAYERWKLEGELIAGLLTRCEKAAEAQLRALQCPTDPAAIYAILAGERRAPWPARTAARDRERARQLMFVLLYIAKVRRQIQFGSENSQRAAYEAVQLGY